MPSHASKNPATCPSYHVEYVLCLTNMPVICVQMLKLMLKKPCKLKVDRPWNPFYSSTSSRWAPCCLHSFVHLFSKLTLFCLWRSCLLFVYGPLITRETTHKFVFQICSTCGGSGLGCITWSLWNFVPISSSLVLAQLVFQNGVWVPMA